MAFDPQDISAPGAKIKVIGVGGGGTNAVSTMIRSHIEGVDFVAANTDVQSLRFALAPTKIQVGKELTKGLGAGADPDIGRDAALEDRHEIQECVSGADMVFITAGMGGGTGTGGAAIVSQIARENNALTVGVVTKPFNFEGKRRRRHAEMGIAKLKEHVDTLVVIPNERLLKIATPDLSMLDAFKLADTVLVNAVRGISDIINVPGTINVDFADVKTVMSSMGHALMGIGTASGEGRAKQAAVQAISSPLLEDVDIEGATGILINITAGEKISLVEINEACSIIEEAAHEDANIIFGAVIDENIKEDIRITVIATGFPTTDEEEFLVPQRPSLSKRSSPLVNRSPRPGAEMGGRGLPKKENYRTEDPFSMDRSYESLHQNQNASFSTTEETRARPAAEANPAAVSSYEDHSAELTRWTLENVPSPPKEETKISKTAPSFHNPVLESFGEESSVPPARTVQTPLVPKSPTMTTAEPTSASLQESITNNLPEEDSITPPDPFDFFHEQEKLSEDIDKRIDEALELAEKVRGIDKKEDDLDVPTFLRAPAKDLDLT